VNDSNSPQLQSSEPSALAASAGGFRAHLQGVNLHDLVLLQRLVRASGVFVILSGDNSGSLHFSSGELFHAETGELSGDAAALEILAWAEGEFINSERSCAATRSVLSSLESLFLKLAKDSDDAKLADAPVASATGIRLRWGRADGGLARGSLLMASVAGLQAPSQQPARPSGGTNAQDIAAAATPGNAAVAPRTAARVLDGRGVANVLVSAQGELVDGHGADPEGLAARVAYLARLTELIGQAMGSGETRSLKVRGPSTELFVRRYPDGSVSGTLGLPEVGADAAPSSTSMPPSAPSPVSTPIPLANAAQGSAAEGLSTLPLASSAVFTTAAGGAPAASAVPYSGIAAAAAAPTPSNVPPPPPSSRIPR
jgi:hypothetical protein